jgi:hypothetical protein
MIVCALNCVIRDLGLAIQTGIEPDNNKVQRDSPSFAQQALFLHLFCCSLPDSAMVCMR